MGEAFEGGVAAGPADAVQHDVAEPHRTGEMPRVEPRQHHAKFCRIEAVICEGAFEPGLEHCRDMGRVGKRDEGEWAIAGLAGDAGEYLIELRQVLVDSLAAPEYDGLPPQPEVGAGQRYRRGRERLVMYREVREADQFFGVMVGGSRQFHQFAAEIIVECRKSAGVWMAPRGA